MKRIIITLALAFIGVSATSAFSQELRFGIKGGINYYQAPKVNNILTSEARNGYHVGPMVDLSLSFLPVSLDAALLFSTAPSELKSVNDAWEKVINTNYVELPINVKVNVFNVPAMKVMLVAGPFFNYLISHNLKEITEHFEQADQFKADKFSIGLNAGVGIEVLKMLQITATYNAIFSNSYKFQSIKDSANDFIQAQNKGFRLSAAVLF